MSSQLTVEERAYLAGFIDGDGCIFISKSKQSRRPWLQMHRLVVIMTQANKAFLELWQQKTCLGRVYLSNRKHGVYQWHCASKDAEKLLRLVFDFLVIKKEQARIGLDFRQTKGSEFGGGGQRKDSMPLVRKREAYRQQLMALKKDFKTADIEQDDSEYDPCPPQMKLNL
jgi:hypothetical protein